MSIKAKFTSSDVRAMVRDVRNLAVGKRVANIYDISEKIYLLKFATPGTSEKVMLLMESGTRFHCTKYSRVLPEQPSPFAMKVRRYLRTKRLENITQLGFDRVVDLRFGSGESVNHLLLELYAGGNIVLTDANYEVIALLRSHQFSPDVSLKVGEIYPIAFTTNLTCTTLNNTVEAKEELLKDTPFLDEDAFKNWLRMKLNTMAEDNKVVEGEKKKKAKPPSLKQVLLHKDSSLSHYGPEIIEHILVSGSLLASCKLEQALKLSSEQFAALQVAIVSSFDLISQLEHDHVGYIIYKPFAKVADSSDNKEVEYCEFTPILLAQHQASTFYEHVNFSSAVDEYFYKIEDQKAQKELLAKEEAANRKLQKVKEEQAKLVQHLSSQQVSLQNHAMLLELHHDEVDKVCLVINSALASEMTWDAIEEMVETEQERGNPIAALISSLKLEKNVVVLKFPKHEIADNLGSDSDNEEDDAIDAKDEFIEVEVDLTISAYANARKMYESKKTAYAKEVKTIQHSEKVVKTVTEQTLKTLENQKLTHSIRAIRKVHWFEKFNWFITSEGFLVLSGKDAQQNDLLYRKYLRPDDIYVHADLSGASSCIVRAKRHNPNDLENKNVSSVDQKFYVTPLAIQEAGCMAVCRSRTWAAKVIASSYWVKASQVSKKAPSGEFLSTGSFMIYGKKNFLPPMALEMGFGILFRLDDESVSRHLHDRKVRDYDLDMETASTFQDAMDRYNLQSDDVEGEMITSSTATAAQPVEEAVEDDVAEEEAAAVEVSKEGEGEEEDDEESEDEEEDKEEEDEEEAPQPIVAKGKQDGKAGKGQQQSNKGGNKNKAGDSKAAAGKGNKKNAKQEVIEEEEEVLHSKAASNKKKTINKKKARRYAEQDEEDRERAMMVLGHASKKTGETLGDKRAKEETEKKKQDLQSKQSKAGISLVKTNWTALMALLSDEVRAALQEIINEGLIKEGDIDEVEMKTLSTFSVDNGLKLLTLFRDDSKLSKVANKTGFLAGIMRRLARELENHRIVETTLNTKTDQDDDVDLSKLNVQDRKEVQAILEEEGFLDEEEGKQADDLDKLTACPLPEDRLLYAVPMCGPYMSMHNFKFKVKLTPGPAKKGKAAKQAVDLFMKSKECGESEKALMKCLHDNELVAAMIGDVKLSMPGLHQLQKSSKKQRGQKK